MMGQILFSGGESYPFLTLVGVRCSLGRYLSWISVGV